MRSYKLIPPYAKSFIKYQKLRMVTQKNRPFQAVLICFVVIYSLYLIFPSSRRLVTTSVAMFEGTAS